VKGEKKWGMFLLKSDVSGIVDKILEYTGGGTVQDHSEIEDIIGDALSVKGIQVLDDPPYKDTLLKKKALKPKKKPVKLTSK
jgi:hypothetical protein